MEFGELGDKKKEVTEVLGKVKWFNNSKGYGFIGRMMVQMSLFITRLSRETAMAHPGIALPNPH